VPIPKPKDVHSKAMTCNDVRGIAISPVIAKVFEHYFLSKFNSLFVTEENQFGFKKGSAVVTLFTLSANLLTATVNLCTIDLSMAFDKVKVKSLET